MGNVARGMLAGDDGEEERKSYGSIVQCEEWVVVSFVVGDSEMGVVEDRFRFDERERWWSFKVESSGGRGFETCFKGSPRTGMGFGNRNDPEEETG